MSKIVANQISPRSGDIVTINGSVSVAGTITYEDVTNVDSVGLVTARSGLRVVGGGLTVTGVSTFFNTLNLANGSTNVLSLDADNSQNSVISHLGSGSFTVKTNNANDILIWADHANGDITLRRGTGVGVVNVLTTSSTGISVTGTVTATGGVEGNINATSAAGISTVGILTAYGGVSDAIGPVRRLGITAHNAGTLTLDTSHAGNLIREQTNSANITIPQNVFTPGDMITIFNVSGGDNTITQGTGVTLYNTGDGATGNRTLAAKGVCTLACTSTNEFIISGSGLS